MIRVRLTPRGGRDRIDGWIDDPGVPGAALLKVRVTAPPLDGAANRALVALLARSLRIARSAVEITSGQNARIKTVRIGGVNARDLDQL